MIAKIKELLNKANSKGIPVPLIKDPATGVASVSLTLVVMSATYVQIGLLNSLAQVFKGIDMQSALYFFGTSCALYFSRKVSGDGKKMEISGVDKEK
jgi:hypothetical protein